MFLSHRFEDLLLRLATAGDEILARSLATYFLPSASAGYLGGVSSALDNSTSESQASANSATRTMNAHLHLDDDLASYLNEQAKQEHTTLDVVINRLLRRAVPGKAKATALTPSWLAEIRVLREQCSTGKPGTPVEQLITEIRS